MCLLHLKTQFSLNLLTDLLSCYKKFNEHKIIEVYKILGHESHSINIICLFMNSIYVNHTDLLLTTFEISGKIYFV